jgi:hypothetical protein
MKYSVILLAAVLFQHPVFAEIVRWVDERGVVHYSDVNPAKSKTVPQEVQIRGRPATELEKQEIEARLQKYRDLLRTQPDAAPAAGEMAIVPAPQPAAADKDKPGCEAQWKKYLGALACFDRYANGNGSVRPEAFRNCAVVSQPEYCKNRSTRD